jgi:hypothetical protein
MTADLIAAGAGAGVIGASAYAANVVAKIMRENFPKSNAEIDTTIAGTIATIRRWVAEGEAKLSQAIAKVVAERPIKHVKSHPPVNVLFPLAEAAALEDDDELRKSWAHMFVNAIDADSRVEVRRAYVSLFQDLTRLDVQILAKLHSVEDAYRGKPVHAEFLPDEARIEAAELVIDGGDAKGAQQWELPRPEVVRSLWNLVRLGLITADSMGSGDDSLTFVSLTSLGVGLVEACTSPKAEEA